MNIRSPRIGPQPWEVVRTKLDQSLPFANMRDTPYYRDAVWEQFSKQEYERRYRALRAKMREQKLDALIVPGGPAIGNGTRSQATSSYRSRANRRWSIRWAAPMPKRYAGRSKSRSRTSGIAATAATPTSWSSVCAN